jgi:hypothetical protein
MKEETSNHPRIIAYCGLYCSNCNKFKNEKCPGCMENEKASWCKIRLCCREREIANCGECKEFQNPMDCSMYNNFMSRAFGFIFRSDRARCVAHIRAKGADDYANFMIEKGWVSYPRGKKV